MDLHACSTLDGAHRLGREVRVFHGLVAGLEDAARQPQGGATQPQGHVQIVVNVIDFGMNIQEAGDAPRILHTGSSQPTGGVMDQGGTVSLESGYSWEVQRELVGRGHTLERNLGSFGGYQGIRWDKSQGVFYGASESRKDGQAAGY